MGLFSFLNRPPTASAAPDKAQAVDAARTRARRRLIGAVLLLGVGVIAFPLLFETQPRPIPVDIPIEIPRKDGVPPLALPASRPAPAAAASGAVASKPPPAAVITESKTEGGKELSAPVEASVKPAARPEPRAKPAAASVAPVPVPEPKPTAEAAGRFVVQVGAFADAAVAREARAKVDKLGLRTYTQVIDTDSGKRTRVRLGPFGSREEADKAATKVKAAGLPAAVLTL